MSHAPAKAGTDAARKGDPSVIANLPNFLTMLRLLLCVAFFAILVYANLELRLPVDGEGELHWRNWRGQQRIYEAHEGLRAAGATLTLLFDIAFGIFLLAAATDTLDGQIARRYGLETDFGRIADPFVDKIMILGALTLLMPLTVHVPGWLVTLVLARELLVSGIRGFAEARGIAFPASFWGKTKMVSQIAAVAAGVEYIGHPESRFWEWTFLILLWWTIAATVFSGAMYVLHAYRMLRPKPAPPGAAP